MRAILVGLLLGCCGLSASVAADQVPIARGADVGWLSEMEAAGTTFYDENGQPKDCLQILKDHGVNAIRLRVWVNPPKGWCGKDDVVKMAKRAAAMGFRLLIDFHYSDTWADPQKQPKPAAWQKDTPAQLEQHVYDHTFEVLKALEAAGVRPEWVQVGNEITNGMLWPEGKTANWAELVRLVNRGYDAVKAVDPAIQVVVHLNNGQDNAMYRQWFDGAIKGGMKFDVIGMSLYPDRPNSGTLAVADACLANLRDMAARYGKGVMICEVGYFADEPQATKELLAKVIKGCEAIPDGRGLGVFYWEPESFTQHYDRGAWQANGRPTLAIDAFGTN
ncbi:MAG: glycosyl hydrolase 53 family protein [Verrucomicrobiota bacterium]